MTKKYYTLLIRVSGLWHIEFGDYDREVVEDELDDREGDLINGKDSLKRKDMKIIITGDKQADIDSKVAQLNSTS